MITRRLFLRITIILFMTISIGTAPNLFAQKEIDFTLDSAVEIMMESSYRIKLLKMEIEQRMISISFLCLSLILHNFP